MEKLTFTWLEFQVMPSAAFKHNMQVLQMLFLSFGEDSHVTQVE